MTLAAVLTSDLADSSFVSVTSAEFRTLEFQHLPNYNLLTIHDHHSVFQINRAKPYTTT
jgi:hypothetical protein